MDTAEQFQRAESEYNRLRSELDSGSITTEQFDAAVKRLTVQDDQGHFWVMGENGYWSMSDRPAPAPPTPTATSPSFTPTPSPSFSPRPSRLSGSMTIIALAGLAILGLVCLLAAGGLYVYWNSGRSPIVTNQTPTPLLAPSLTAAPTMDVSAPTPLVTPASSTTPPSPEPTVPPPCKDSASFVADVTIPPGAASAPNQTWTKIWRIKNEGNCAWDANYHLVFLEGEAMTGQTDIPVAQATVPGATVDLAVPITAPPAVGPHSGQWQLRGPRGVFGPSFALSLTVVNPLPPGCPGVPTIASFEGVPATISPGDSAMLVWGKVDNATRAEIDQGIGGIATPGSRTVKPKETTTYTLKATGCGRVVTKQVTITVLGTTPNPAMSTAEPSSLGFTFSQRRDLLGPWFN